VGPILAVVRRGARNRRGGGGLVILVGVGAFFVAGLGVGVLALLTSVFGGADSQCGSPTVSAAGAAAGIVLGPAGAGQLVGATEYGGPGDPSSGILGSSGANLLQTPDSYAELGGTTFQTATAMGGLPYLTPLRITWGSHSAIAYKRDIGLGGASIDGLPRVLDLWWELAGRLGIPYDDGLWSGPVQVARPPAAGAGNVLGQAAATSAALVPPNTAAEDPGACAPTAVEGVPVTTADHAQLLSDGLAAAPADAPPAVQEIIAAGNQIVGKPYEVGGGHGLPLSEIAPSYDCSSSVEHLMYGASLLPVTYDAASGTLESYGEPGPGRWVTIYANADHVFMYVDGLRWDTHNAAGPDDGSAGIGWHPLIRSDAGFVARHPVGL
jgi:cell wall-associated NlpC family hydrolase